METATGDMGAVGRTSSDKGDSAILPDLLLQVPPEEQIGTATGDVADDMRRCYTAVPERDGTRRHTHLPQAIWNRCRSRTSHEPLDKFAKPGSNAPHEFNGESGGPASGASRPKTLMELVREGKIAVLIRRRVAVLCEVLPESAAETIKARWLSVRFRNVDEERCPPCAPVLDCLPSPLSPPVERALVASRWCRTLVILRWVNTCVS